MSRRAMVLVAVGVVLILVALVGARLWQRALHPPAREIYPQGDRQTVMPRFQGLPPVAHVPEPPQASLAGLAAPPCWSCRSRRVPQPEFSIDLDRLAPLGDGEGNLAEWLKDFAPNGVRQQESRGAGSRVDLFGEQTAVREADDPVLVEAEAWADQAVCSFYPDVYEIRGEETYIPNLVMAMTLARSWVARGLASMDADAAREDMRRSIRLGRLLRQDDFTVIQELVGLTAIRLGAEGLYELARRGGDVTEMVLAGRALADVDGIRLLVQEGLADFVDLTTALNSGRLAQWLTDSAGAIDRIAASALGDGRRPLRAEAIMALGFTLRGGNRKQRETSRVTLLAAVEQGDPVLAPLAAWFLENAETTPRLAWGGIFARGE